MLDTIVARRSEGGLIREAELLANVRADLVGRLPFKEWVEGSSPSSLIFFHVTIWGHSKNYTISFMFRMLSKDIKA